LTGKWPASTGDERRFTGQIVGTTGEVEKGKRTATDKIFHPEKYGMAVCPLSCRRRQK